MLLARELAFILSIILPSKDFRQHWGHAVSHDFNSLERSAHSFYIPSPEKHVLFRATLPKKDKVIAMYYGVDIGDIVATSSDPLLLKLGKGSNTGYSKSKIRRDFAILCV